MTSSLSFTAENRSVKHRRLIRSAALLCAVVSPFAVAAEAPAGLTLAQKYSCTACHGLDHAIVGPAYQAVAAKYKGDAGAEAKLMAKVKAGGSGVWGAVPMPPQAQVPDADLKSIVAWVLTGAKAAK